MKRHWYKVLIVEDEAVARQGLERFVEKSNLSFQVVGVASNGEEALGKTQALQPDLIITDIDMPKMDGIAFLAALRDRNNEAEVIIISCYSHFSYAQKAVSLNVISYLLKPFIDEELNEMLGKAKERLDNKRKSRQLTEIEQFVMKEKDTILLDLLREAIIKPPNEELMGNLLLFGLPVDASYYGLLSVRYDKSNTDIRGFAHGLNESSYVIEMSAGSYLVLICSKNHYSTRMMQHDLLSYGQRLAEHLKISYECISMSDVFFSLDRAHIEYRELSFQQEIEKTDNDNSISQQTRKEIENSKEFIENNYHDKELDLTMVADSVYMSPYYFSRLFNHEVGMSLTTYINTIRIEHACALLEGGNYKIYEVSELVGFHSETYFNRIFKKNMGHPPKKYMQLQGKK